MKPVMPNGHRIHYTQGMVTTVAPVYSVDITFFPLECGHDFPLLSVVPEQVFDIKMSFLYLLIKINVIYHHFLIVSYLFYEL